MSVLGESQSTRAQNITHKPQQHNYNRVHAKVATHRDKTHTMSSLLASPAGATARADSPVKRWSTDLLCQCNPSADWLTVRLLREA